MFPKWSSAGKRQLKSKVTVLLQADKLRHFQVIPFSITHEIKVPLVSNHFLHPSNVWTLITYFKEKRANESWGTVKEMVVTISRFRREMSEIYTLLGYYAASSGKF